MITVLSFFRWTMSWPLSLTHQKILSEEKILTSCFINRPDNITVDHKTQQESFSLFLSTSSEQFSCFLIANLKVVLFHQIVNLLFWYTIECPHIFNTKPVCPVIHMFLNYITPTKGTKLFEIKKMPWQGSFHGMTSLKFPWKQLLWCHSKKHWSCTQQWICVKNDHVNKINAKWHFCTFYAKWHLFIIGTLTWQLYRLSLNIFRYFIIICTYIFKTHILLK